MSMSFGSGRRPGQLDQRVEIGADHAVLARRLGRALQPAQLLARHRLDLGRHLGLGDRLLEIGELLLVGALVAQLALDGGHLLAQQHLALARVERGLGLVADLGRQPQHLEAMGQQLRDLVEARHQIDGLEHLLLLRRRDVEIGRGEVGQHGRARSSPRRSGAARAARCGSRSSTSRTWSCRIEEARLDLRPGRGRLGDVQAARQQEGVAVDELGDAEALHALADQVMAAVGRW